MSTFLRKVTPPLKYDYFNPGPGLGHWSLQHFLAFCLLDHRNRVNAQLEEPIPFSLGYPLGSHGEVGVLNALQIFLNPTYSHTLLYFSSETLVEQVNWHTLSPSLKDKIDKLINNLPPQYDADRRWNFAVANPLFTSVEVLRELIRTSPKYESVIKILHNMVSSQERPIELRLEAMGTLARWRAWDARVLFNLLKDQNVQIKRMAAKALITVEVRRDGDGVRYVAERNFRNIIIRTLLTETDFETRATIIKVSKTNNIHVVGLITIPERAIYSSAKGLASCGSLLRSLIDRSQKKAL